MGLLGRFKFLRSRKEASNSGRMGSKVSEKELADAFIAYINILSNVIQSSQHILKVLDDSTLRNLTGPEIWELSSKKISLGQIMLDIEFMRRVM